MDMQGMIPSKFSLDGWIFSLLATWPSERTTVPSRRAQNSNTEVDGLRDEGNPTVKEKPMTLCSLPCSFETGEQDITTKLGTFL